MVQCNQLSNEQPMYELAMVFKKYLREYASKVLEFSIPKLLPPTSSIGKSYYISYSFTPLLLVELLDSFSWIYKNEL